MPFVHLHTHSEYSLLDGAIRIDDLVAHVQRLGMDSLAVTDHGNLHAAWSFYAAAKAARLRPILGFEAYLAYGDRHSPQKPPDAPKDYSHLVLLARNREGYRNLIRLSSIGYVEGFYRRPRIDKEVLAKHAGGIVCLAACLSGEVAQWLRLGTLRGCPGLGGVVREPVRARGLLAGDPGARHPRGAAGHRRHAPAGPGARPGGGRHQRRALPAPGGRRSARRAAGHRHRLRPRRSEAIPVHRAGILREERKGNAGALPGAPRRHREHREGRRALRVRFRETVPRSSFPKPAGYDDENVLLRDLAERGARARYGDPLPPDGAHPARLRAVA